jgi:nicotinate-nucleotide--dimethylbenzimidazole phosphoribosyltransferase
MYDFLPAIPSIQDDTFTQHVQQLLDHKTKPVGSLGVLERLALRVATILGQDQPLLQDPQMVIFAADHGLAARGVSAYPTDVTWQMVENFLAGGAAVSVLSRTNGIHLNIVDCGVARDIARREQTRKTSCPSPASRACGAARWPMARRTARSVPP